jgi:hypothetical protein
MSLTPFIWRATPLLLASMILAAAGCASNSGTSADSDQDAATAVASAIVEPSAAEGEPESEPTPGTNLTACELVAPADIEAALGLAAGTVSEGTVNQTPTSLDPASNECRYDDQDWGGLVVLATPTDGVNTFDALTKAYGDSAEAIDVGDGAYWFEDNDRGYFLKGPVLVIVQFTHIADGTKFRDPSIELGKALVAKV